MVKEYAEGKKLILCEASAKTGDHVVKVFDAIAQNLPKTEEHLAANTRAFTSAGSRKIDLGFRGGKGVNKSSCC